MSLETKIRELLYTTPEFIDPDKYIIATYYIEGKAPITKMAEEAAIENSTGTWTLVGYETLEIRDKYGAKIVRILGQDGSAFVELAINAENYDPEVGGIYNLLADIAGNIYDMKILDNVKLVDLKFPKYSNIQSG